jgi:hypothetical protein
METKKILHKALIFSQWAIIFFIFNTVYRVFRDAVEKGWLALNDQ